MNKVLVVSAHMDDEVLGCGGTIFRHVRNGASVTVCVAAGRAYGHVQTKRTTDEEMADCLAAKEILGYQEIIFLNLPDESLGESLIALISDLERALANVKPEIIYIPSREDYNQDHRAVFNAMMVVCRSHAPERAVGIYAYESHPAQGYVFCPNRYVGLDEGGLDAKMRAMKCYRRESRNWPHARSLRAIETRARYRGMEVGLGAAEAFMTVRSLWV